MSYRPRWMCKHRTTVVVPTRLGGLMDVCARCGKPIFLRWH